MKDYGPHSVVLDEVLVDLNLSKLETLILSRWSVTSSTFEMLPLRLPELTHLELESLTMINEDEDALMLALQQLAKSYSGKLYISMEGLRYKYSRTRNKEIRLLRGNPLWNIWKHTREGFN